MEKTCRTCKEVKPITEFYKHPMMGDGHLNHCRTCKCSYQRQRGKALLDNPLTAFIEADRHRKKSLRQYHEKRKHDPEYHRRTRESRAEWAERNREKRAAHHAVNNAVRDGRMDKPEVCSDCGATGVRIHGHHEDYSKPLEVIWVCPPCHGRRHWKIQEAA